MLKVGIIGASGYTGTELFRILLTHPEAEACVLTSETFAGKKISDIYPNLNGYTDKRFESFSLGKTVKSCDIVFTALPHKASMSLVPDLIDSGKKVIDLSADFRLQDKVEYEKWYATKHICPELIDKSVYGIPELNKDKIKSATLVANPGCYPTSVLLGLAPAIKNGIIDLSSIIIDSKSGISGAGRNNALAYQYSECNDKVKAYSVAKHRHIPEIEQGLSLLAKKNVSITFTPHLVPITRGMLSTIYCSLEKKIDRESICELYTNFYNGNTFVRVMEDETINIGTHSVAGSNYCDIGIYTDKENSRLIIVSVIDNLIKGASGQAIQNMNIMYGFDENAGLNTPPLYP